MMLSKLNRFFKSGVSIDDKDKKLIIHLKECNNTISEIVKKKLEYQNIQFKNIFMMMHLEGILK